MTKSIQILTLIVLTMVMVLLGLYLYETYFYKGTNKNSLVDRTANFGSYTQTANVSSVLARLTVLQKPIAFAQAQQGRWPDDLSDLGFQASDFEGEQGIDGIQVVKGSIYANLSSDFFPGATLRLKPENGMGGLSINWRCETNIELRQMYHCQFNPTVQYPDE